MLSGHFLYGQFVCLHFIFTSADYLRDEVVAPPRLLQLVIRVVRRDQILTHQQVVFSVTLIVRQVSPSQIVLGFPFPSMVDIVPLEQIVRTITYKVK